MAAAVIEAAAGAVARAGLKNQGKKRVFLPGYVITFVRPNPGQPPNQATFAVPLKFNKFDMRDYLYNVYGVETCGMRSFINQPVPQRRDNGSRYRPQSKKMMVAELVKPFVWPEPPAKNMRDQFDYNAAMKLEAARKDRTAQQKNREIGKIPLRTDVAVPEDRRELRRQAERFMLAPHLWEEGGLRKGGWKEVENDQSFDPAKATVESVEETPEAR